MSEQYRCKSCGYVFDMKDMMCSECGVGYLERLRWTKGGDGSHFEGCEDVHLDCRIAQLEKEIARLNVELLELNDKAVFIEFENEDELPAEIKDDVYSAMFECSHVDGVRLFPYIEENGQKYFLVMIEEENKSRYVDSQRIDDFVGDSDHEHDDRIL